MNKLLVGLFSILIGFFFGAIILQLSGISPVEAFEVFISGAFSKPNYIAYILIKSTPLILTALSIGFAFKTGLFNIGAEGQFIIGAMTAAVLGYLFNFPFYIQIPFLIISAIITSGLYGGLSGFLKAKYGVHEVLSTIMLNWIALYLSNYFIFIEKLRRPNMETTEFINSSSSIVILEDWKNSEAGISWLNEHEFFKLFLRPPVNAGIIIALICVFLIWFLLKKTSYGQKLKAVGLSPLAATYAGINTKLKITQSMMISGALSGLAGATHVMGVSKNIAVLSAFEGYGFDGIAASLIGANHPVGVVFSGLFLGTLKYAGQKIQPQLDAPGELINIIVGLIVFFISMPKIINFTKKRWGKK